MAYAIHRTERGDSLEAVARQYYTLRHRHGPIDALKQERVIRAIRAATPVDSPASERRATACCPKAPRCSSPRFATSRGRSSLSRKLVGDLAEAGFTDAWRLLRQSPGRIAARLPKGRRSYGMGEVERAWVLTALLNLDGIDRFTARHLHDDRHVASLKALAEDLAGEDAEEWITEGLVRAHRRPEALLAQGHARRWITAALVHGRPRCGELTKAFAVIFDVPIPPAALEKEAERYETTRPDRSRGSGEPSTRSMQAALYRVQAAVLRGHAAILAGHAADAVRSYQDARRRWHDLARSSGAASDVDDVAGLSLAQCVETARRMVGKLPSPSGASTGTSPRARRAAKPMPCASARWPTMSGRSCRRACKARRGSRWDSSASSGQTSAASPPPCRTCTRPTFRWAWPAPMARWGAPRMLPGLDRR